MVAASSIYDMTTAHFMMEQLCSRENNRELAAYIENTYHAIVEHELVKEPVVEPNSTYYCFGKTNFDLSKVIYMNGSYFELNYPDDFIRVNILSPDIPLPAAV
jgi:hypothetical protein